MQQAPLCPGERSFCPEPLTHGGLPGEPSEQVILAEGACLREAGPQPRPLLRVVVD